MKALAISLGLLAAALILSQLFMGQMILRTGHNPSWATPHQHMGYLTVVVSLLYITWSVIIIATSKRGTP